MLLGHGSLGSLLVPVNFFCELLKIRPEGSIAHRLGRGKIVFFFNIQFLTVMIILVKYEDREFLKMVLNLAKV